MKLLFVICLVFQVRIISANYIDYYKCYSLLVGTPPELNKDKTLDDCFSLLDNTMLNKDGMLAKSDMISVKILNNLNNVHKSWLLIDDIKNISNSTSFDSTKDYFDSSEASLFVTRSLFSKEASFHDIVTLKHNLKAVRKDSTGRGPYSKRLFKNESIFSSENCLKNQSSCEPFWSGRGELVGIKKEVEIERRYQFLNKGRKESGSALFGEHFGAGMLGSQYYLLANIVENYGYQSDGVVEVGRVWSIALLNDVLCRSLPVLKNNDSLEIMKITSTNDPLIRSSEKCIRCHTTIDLLAGAIRSFHFKKPPTEGKVTKSFNGPVLANFFRVNNEFKHDAWLSTPNFKYKKSKGAGRLFYRDSKGKLINRSFNDLNGLGHVIKEQDDFYSCFISRYYEYFSGNKVNNEALTKYVLTLKKTQSLKTIIKNIIKDVLNNE